MLKKDGQASNPHKNLRLFWAIILGILPAALVLYSDHSVALDIILITSLACIEPTRFAVVPSIPSWSQYKISSDDFSW